LMMTMTMTMTMMMTFGGDDDYDDDYDHQGFRLNFAKMARPVRSLRLFSKPRFCCLL